MVRESQLQSRNRSIVGTEQRDGEESENVSGLRGLSFAVKKRIRAIGDKNRLACADNKGQDIFLAREGTDDPQILTLPNRQGVVKKVSWESAVPSLWGGAVG
jgi:hypothetical protein